MFRNLDNQSEQNDRDDVSVMQRVLGVAGEEEYFARREVELRRKLAEERQAKVLAEERERERALHLMKCPKCGMQLEEIAFGDVRVDKWFLARASGWTRGNSRPSGEKKVASWGECGVCFSEDSTDGRSLPAQKRVHGNAHHLQADGYLNSSRISLSFPMYS